MADQSDVETLLVEMAASALYPNGATNPSAVGPVCRVYRGWPTPAGLDADLGIGIVNVSVFPIDGGARTTTRYPETWFPTQATAPTLTAAVSGITATFSGTAASGQVAGLRVDDRSFVYRVQDGDTPAAVAANLGTMARSAFAVSVVASSVAIPGAGTLQARVVADTPTMQEVRRQVRDFRITCWCASPAIRDSVATTLDQRFATARFVTFPDTTTGRLIFSGSTVFDQSENATLYRRDLVYTVEYPTILTAVQPAMLFGSGTLDEVAFIA